MSLIGEDIHRREHEFLVPYTALQPSSTGLLLHSCLTDFLKLHSYNASKKLCPTSSKSRKIPDITQSGYDHNEGPTNIVDAARDPVLSENYANLNAVLRRLRYSANLVHLGDAMRKHEKIVDALRRRAGAGH